MTPHLDSVLQQLAFRAGIEPTDWIRFVIDAAGEDPTLEMEIKQFIRRKKPAE